jgi:hypothetical protein
MVDILTARKSESLSSQQQLLLDILNTQRLILQPTNSRPRLLMDMYSTLYDIGWGVQTERIEYISSRWYLTIAFHRSSNCGKQIPGIHIANSKESNATGVLMRWVAHHRNWIRADSSKTGTINPDDVVWLNKFDFYDDDAL